MRKWIIEEAHNSNWLVECEYDSREEAEDNLKEIEECDKRNGEYKPNRYRIAEIETENDDMKETIEKYEEEIEAVYARNRELEEIVYRLRNEVEALKEERTFLEAVTANSDNEIMKLKSKLYDLMTEKEEQTMAKKKEYRVMFGIIDYTGEVYDESVIAIFYSGHRAFHYKDMCNEQTTEGTVYWIEEK